MNRLEEEDEEESQEEEELAKLQSEMAPESGNGSMSGNVHRFGKVSSVSSIDSIDGDQMEAYISDCPSDDLDKLSMCLSEVSSENPDGRKQSLFSDIVQAQLALWTLIFSIFYSYAWQQHRKKFLFSLFFVVPPVILVCCTISSLLTTIVILGRIFSTPLRFQDMFKFGKADEDEVRTNLSSTYGGSGSLRRRRSMSGNSCHSSVSNRSSSCEELPKPTCRKHSAALYSGSTLSLVCGTPTSPPTGNGFTNGFTTSHNGFAYSGSYNGLHSSNGLNYNRSASMSSNTARPKFLDHNAVQG